ncbi:MAG: alpha/beta hydrolase [Acidimicrobiia bacterium]|nr:alpha/beta hydrolase [Acidimicrobiia bacterium]
MSSITSTLATPDGIELLTREWECQSPKGRLLMIHGLGEHCGRWDHVGTYFVERGFAVHAFDLRGHGASGGRRVDIERFDQFLDDVEFVFAGIPHDVPAAIYGHSMGGFIATAYAVSDRPQPDLFVLSAPALDAELPAPLKIASNVLSRVTPKLMLPNSLKGEQLSRDPEVGKRYFADPLVQTKVTARFGEIMLGQLPVIRDQIDKISRPTLVIHGANDPLVPPHASAPLAAVDGVERKLFPGLRHETHNEPEQGEVLGFVADWLDSQLA